MSSDSSDDGEFKIKEDFVQSPQHKRAGTSAVDFDGLLSPPLKLHEDLTEGCGGQLWPAGMVLAKYLLRKPQLDTLRGKRMCVVPRLDSFY